MNDFIICHSLCCPSHFLNLQPLSRVIRVAYAFSHVFASQDFDAESSKRILRFTPSRQCGSPFYLSRWVETGGIDARQSASCRHQPVTLPMLLKMTIFVVRLQSSWDLSHVFCLGISTYLVACSVSGLSLRLISFPTSQSTTLLVTGWIENEVRNVILHVHVLRLRPLGLVLL